MSGWLQPQKPVRVSDKRAGRCTAQFCSRFTLSAGCYVHMRITVPVFGGCWCRVRADWCVEWLFQWSDGHFSIGQNLTFSYRRPSYYSSKPREKSYIPPSQTTKQRTYHASCILHPCTHVPRYCSKLKAVVCVTFRMKNHHFITSTPQILRLNDPWRAKTFFHVWSHY